jgi:hypothetical protein
MMQQECRLTYQNFNPLLNAAFWCNSNIRISNPRMQARKRIANWLCSGVPELPSELANQVIEISTAEQEQVRGVEST